MPAGQWPALWVFLGSYVVFAGLPWFCYLSALGPVEKAPSLAYASI
jgi:hypothetical protein